VKKRKTLDELAEPRNALLLARRADPGTRVALRKMRRGSRRHAQLLDQLVPRGHRAIVTGWPTPSGLDRKVGSGDFRICDVTLGNTGSLQYPLIIRFDHSLQVVIGKHTCGHVASKGGDFYFTHGSSGMMKVQLTLIC
jgi:hypothetical protein